MDREDSLCGSILVLWLHSSTTADGLRYKALEGGVDTTTSVFLLLLTNCRHSIVYIPVMNACIRRVKCPCMRVSQSTDVDVNTVYVFAPLLYARGEHTARRL